jgi:hypothetical protein
MKKFLSGLFFTWLAALLPMIAFAQSRGNCSDRSLSDVDRYFTGVRYCSANTLLVRVVDLVFIIAGMTAVLFVVIGGFRYIVSAGSDDQAKAGRKTITYALIGLVIIILAYTIVSVISNTAKGGT